MWIFVILMALGAVGYLPVRWAAVPALRRHLGPRFVLSFAILIFAGMVFSPNTYFVLCIAVMIFLTQGRLDAVCRFVLLAALIPSPPYPLIIGGTYLINLSTLDVLSVGLWLAIALKPDRSRVAKVSGWTVHDVFALLLFIVINAGAQRFSDGLNGILRQLLSGGLQLLLPYMLMRRHLRTIDEYRIIVGCVAASCAILSVFAVYEAAKGWSLFASINANFGEANVGLRNFMIRGNTLRASASMQGALMLGCYMSVGWIAMICSRTMVRGRLLWLGGCGLITVGELSAQSRGSLVVISLAATVLLAAHRRPLLAAASIAAAGCGAGILIAAARFSPKIAGFLNLDTARQVGEEYDYRQILFRRGMEEAAKHRWTGSDISSVMVRLDDIKQGQGIIDFVNTYLYLYLVGGLLGMIPIALLLVWIFRNSVAAFRRSDDEGTVAVRAFAIAAMLAVLVQLSFMSFIDHLPVLLALTLAGMRLYVVTQRRSRPAAPARSARPAARSNARPRPLPG